MANMEKEVVSEKSRTLDNGEDLSAATKKQSDEKDAFAGPVYITPVREGFIKDTFHQNRERLENLAKTEKPTFNTQDFADLEWFRMILSPENWDMMLFNEESLHSYRGGTALTGTRIMRDGVGIILRDEDNMPKTHIVPVEEATSEDLRNTVILHILNPVGVHIATLMTCITQETLDAMNPRAVKSWVGITDALDAWVDPAIQKRYPLLKNPFAPQSKADIILRSRDIRQRLANSK